MFIDPDSAAHFISGYKILLSVIYHLSEEDPISLPLLEMLSEGSNALDQDPILLNMAAAALAESGKIMPDDVLRALKSLRLRHWVYLKDTTKHSIFIGVRQRSAQQDAVKLH